MARVARRGISDDTTPPPVDQNSRAQVLLVNDISRGGRTLQVAYDTLKGFFQEDNILTATLFCHRDAATKPRFNVVETDESVRLDWKEVRSG
jgi:hypoxanthine phosphoribosyltransferase